MIPEGTHDAIKATTQALVLMLDEATNIIDFFNKQDEVKGMKKQIRRMVFDKLSEDKELVNTLQERFMDLAKKHFSNKQSGH